MGERLHTRLQKDRKTVYAAAILLILFLFMLWHVNFFLAQSILSYLGMYSIPVIAAFYLYFRGFRDGKEIKLLILFSAWLLITRVLNGDRVLSAEGWIVVESLLMFSFAGLGLTLDRDSGRKVLKIAASAAGVYFFALGCLCVYHWIRLDYVLNPMTEAILGVHLSYGYFLIILGENRNIAALWFYIAACLLLWLFFSCKRKIWRVPIVLAIVVDYLVITGTYSRNVRLAFSASVGAFLLLLFLRSGRLRRPAVKAAAAILLLVISIPLAYKSFDWTAAGVSVISYSVRHQEEAQPAAQTARQEGYSVRPLAAKQPAEAVTLVEREIGFGDSRSFTDDNGRLAIYRTVPEIFRREPKRLLIGCLDENRMAISNELLAPQSFVNLHCSFLDILNYTGLPGLILALWFCVLLLRDMIRLFFAEREKAGLCDQILVIPLAGIMGYSLLESLLFMKQDYRSLSFFLLAGFVIAASKRISGPQSRAKRRSA